MATIDLGLLKTANGLLMLVNLAAALAAIIFWEIHYDDIDIGDRADWQIYYTCAISIALVIVFVVFLLILCGKLTHKLAALICILIAAILVIVAVILCIVKSDKNNYRLLSLLSSAVLGGGLVANVVYTGVGGLKITS